MRDGGSTRARSAVLAAVCQLPSQWRRDLDHLPVSLQVVNAPLLERSNVRHLVRVGPGWVSGVSTYVTNAAPQRRVNAKAEIAVVQPC